MDSSQSNAELALCGHSNAQVSTAGAAARAAARGLYAEPKPPPTVPLLWPLHPEGMPAKAPAWTWKPPPPVLVRGGEGSLGELMNMVDVMAAAWKAKPPPPVPVLDRHAEDSGDDMDSLDAPTLRFGDASSVSTTTPCSSLSYWSDVESED